MTHARLRWLDACLWLAVLSWGTGFGAKLFELVVLIPAWAADPPESLLLLPYGTRWPVNPGDFFQPVSALLLLSGIGALVAGWQAPRPLKTWLWVAVLALIVIWAVTPTLFWPMIQDLIWVRSGRLVVAREGAHALAMKWVWYDWARTVFIAIGFLAAIRSLSLRTTALGLA